MVMTINVMLITRGSIFVVKKMEPFLRVLCHRYRFSFFSFSLFEMEWKISVSVRVDDDAMNQQWGHGRLTKYDHREEYIYKTERATEQVDFQKLVT